MKEIQQAKGLDNHLRNIRLLRLQSQKVVHRLNSKDNKITTIGLVKNETNELIKKLDTTEKVNHDQTFCFFFHWIQLHVASEILSRD